MDVYYSSHLLQYPFNIVSIANFVAVWPKNCCYNTLYAFLSICGYFLLKKILFAIKFVK